MIHRTNFNNDINFLHILLQTNNHTFMDGYQTLNYTITVRAYISREQGGDASSD